MLQSHEPPSNYGPEYMATGCISFFGEVCLSLLHLVRFWRWVRLMILGQATVEALETPNPSDARKREIKLTKKHETHPGRFAWRSNLRLVVPLS